MPQGFREHLATANILSYRVLFFERDDAGFLPPGRYPQLSLAVAGSHDLPPLHAWWEASDLRLKDTLRLFPTVADAQRAWSERGRDRIELADALRRAHACDELADDAELDVEALILGAHRFLARTPAAIAMVQMDDITDESTPVNVPTTSAEYPNWRRRMSLTLEEIVAHPRFESLVKACTAERARSLSE